MTLLDRLLSNDPAQISAASRVLRALRDARELRALVNHLDDIRAHARALSARQPTDERTAALDFVLHKLEHVRSSSRCLCALYLTDDLFDPREEARLGHVRVLDTVRAGEVLDHYACQCTQCGTRYQVEENEYYRTWWAWRVAPARPLIRPTQTRSPAVHV